MKICPPAAANSTGHGVVPQTAGGSEPHVSTRPNVSGLDARKHRYTGSDPWLTGTCARSSEGAFTGPSTALGRDEGATPT